MYEWLTVLGAGGTALTALGLLLRRVGVGGRVVVARETLAVLSCATMEAGQRGHRPATVNHVALALLGDPDVARELEERAVSLTELYADVERLLPPRAESPVKLGAHDGDASVLALLMASAQQGGPLRALAPSPRTVFRALLESGPEALRGVFEFHGLTSDRWPPVSSRSLVAAPAPEGAAETGPYRGPPKVRANADVVFWNDRRTTMQFVTEVLRGTFGVVEPQATRCMLSTHRDGFAVVGSYERHEAERLAKAAMQLAKDNGFPLKVTVEEAGRMQSMSRVGRWLHRLS